MVRQRLVRAKGSTAIDTFRLDPRAALVARPPEASAGEANSEATTTPAATAASHNRHCWRIYLPPSLDEPRPCAAPRVYPVRAITKAAPARKLRRARAALCPSVVATLPAERGGPTRSSRPGRTSP